MAAVILAAVILAAVILAAVKRTRRPHSIHNYVLTQLGSLYREAVAAKTDLTTGFLCTITSNYLVSGHVNYSGSNSPKW